MSQYVKEVKMNLYGGIIPTPIDDKLSMFVEKGLNKAKEFIEEERIIELPWQPVIDTSNLRISRVKRVYKGGEGSIMSTDINDTNNFDIFFGGAFIGQGNDAGIGQAVSNYERMTNRMRILNAMSSDIEFDYNYAQKQLRIYGNKIGGKVIVRYVLDYENVNEIHNSGWCQVVIAFATAFAKQALANIRGYGQQQGGLWTNDAESLLTQAKEEMTAAIENATKMSRRIRVI